MNIFDDISVIKGVGPKIKESLNNCLIFNIMDLILYFPRDYEIINSTENGRNIFCCRVIKIERDIRTKNSKTITTVVFEHEGKRIKGKWFNQPYIKNSFIAHNEYNLLGKLQEFKGELSLINPSIVNKSTFENGKETIIPIYPLKGSITNSILSKLIKEVLNNTSITENMPFWILNKYNFFSLDEAFHTIHFPKDLGDLKNARNRLKYQELFSFSLKLNALKEIYKNEKDGIGFKVSKEMSEVTSILDYELTNAQRKVLREILSDQKKSIPMNRLIQGDVGSGKTIVSLISILNVIKNGYQAALMAPTEILASQHYEEALKFLNKFNVNIELLCGSTTARNKKLIKERINNGETELVIGTHALLENDVSFKNLGLVVTDEQHRFGVIQRSRLINKDKCVDALVMTATPIPRTLSLLLYGDLSVSVIDELPPGRKKIETFVFEQNKRKQVYEFARKEIKLGRQVYVVCPVIEENENTNLNSVNMIFDELKNSYFNDVEIAVIHGKMKGKEKEDIMNKFKNNIIKLIVSTTVIEVGVNVPNATIMIIENADRFGLAQLHQLRGRVGRGVDKSYCMLISSSKNSISKKRLDILKKSNDGFYIAEEDLKLRGSGEIFGFRQHGENNFIIADLLDDVSILKAAYADASEVFQSSDPQNLKIKSEFIEKIEKNSNYICFN
ncbi:MAG: ATP-dependent DNA helicase RecG [Solirubrobacterales bacterium]